MLLAKAADKIVLNILNKIDYGYLELTTYDGIIFKFGDPSHHLKALKIWKKKIKFKKKKIKVKNNITFEN